MSENAIAKWDHFMQSPAWAYTKRDSAWSAAEYNVEGTSINFLQRRVPVLGRLNYLPFVTETSDRFLEQLTSTIKHHKVFSTKMEMYAIKSDELCQKLESLGWTRANQVQYKHTVVVDISLSDEQILANMTRHGRREVRVGLKEGVKVKKVPFNTQNSDLLYELIAETGRRTGAFFRSKNYLVKTWQIFTEKKQGDIFLASHDGNIIAGAFVIRAGQNCFYKDGGSIRYDKQVFAPNTLHWGIMLDARAQGCKFYDLCGVPDPNNPNEANMNGLLIFKSKFMKDGVIELMPAYELANRPMMQKLFTKNEARYLRAYSFFVKDFWY